jgi:two-component system LytT family sensor kinase
MKSIIGRLSGIFSLRLFLNIVLWIVLCFQIYTMNIPNHDVAAINTCKAVSIISLLLFSYFNNFFLVPRYLNKRRYGLYLALAFAWLVIYSFSYSVFIQWIAHSRPSIKIYEIVLFSVFLKAQWSMHAIKVTSIGYLFVYGLWLFIMTMAWYMQDHARLKKAMMQAQQKQTETELSFLKAQINPHFLFNTLNNLYALALRKSDSSPDAILKLSSILRYLLYASNTPTVSFEKEKEIMQAYIDIESLRLDRTDQLQFVITADKPYQIPPLLWLPVLENIFKHGTRTIAEDNYVSFNFEIKNDVLSIYSKNKEKMLGKIDTEQGGIGLENLEKRLALLYAGKYSFSTQRTDDYYISSVKIDLS